MLIYVVAITDYFEEFFGLHNMHLSADYVVQTDNISLVEPVLYRTRCMFSPTVEQWH